MRIRSGRVLGPSLNTGRYWKGELASCAGGKLAVHKECVSKRGSTDPLAIGARERHEARQPYSQRRLREWRISKQLISPLPGMRRAYGTTNRGECRNLASRLATGRYSSGYTGRRHMTFRKGRGFEKRRKTDAREWSFSAEGRSGILGWKKSTAGEALQYWLLGPVHSLGPFSFKRQKK